MLCFWLYEPRKFTLLIKNNDRNECLRVWHNYIPGLYSEGIIYPHTHFSGDMCYILNVGITLSRLSAKVFLGPIQRMSRSGYPRFPCVVLQI